MVNPRLEQYECISINYYQASVIQLAPNSL